MNTAASEIRDADWATAPTTHRARPEAVYFGPPDRPLFGVVHRPPSAWRGARILVCAPLGYEGLFAYGPLNDLAVSLAETAGAVVMRLDYESCGDSAGSDEDDGRVTRMLESIDHAIGYLKSLSETPGPLLLIGLRTGALLAACAAATRDDVHGIALWAACASGKSFLREQKAFSQLATFTAEAPPELARNWGPQGFETNGYVFTDDTVTALEGLSLKALAAPPAPHILMLHRTDMVGPKAPPGWSKAHLEERTAPGYAEMMDPPWLSTPPGEAIRALSEWATRVTTLDATPVVTSLHRGSDSTVMAPGVVEQPVRFGPEGALFGILARPATGKASHATVLVTSTYGYRVGPARLNVMLARRLAALGIATLRLDVGRVGDSREAPGTSPGGPYDERPVEDVLQAARYLTEQGYAHVGLQGVCAGAFLAWRAALRMETPVGLFLANLETFVPIRYTREEHAQFMADEATSGAPPPAPDALPRRALAQAQRFLQYGKRAVIASLPSRLRPGELPAHLVRLGRLGARVVLIFSRSDLGMGRYLLAAGLHHPRLVLNGTVKLCVIDSADHSFTPRWATQRLVDVTVGEMTAWARPR